MSDPTEFEELKKLVFMYFAAPDSVPMATCRQYGERYDWLKKIFQDWMFVFFSVMVYSDKKSEMDADMIQDIQDGRDPLIRIVGGELKPSAHGLASYASRIFARVSSPSSTRFAARNSPRKRPGFAPSVRE